MSDQTRSTAAEVEGGAVEPVAETPAARRSAARRATTPDAPPKRRAGTKSDAPTQATSVAATPTEEAPAKRRSTAKPQAGSRAPRPAKVDAAARAADHREQFLRAYLRHRVGERLARFEAAEAAYARAWRWTTFMSVLLYTGAAALGAVAVADPHRRALWGFLATVAAAAATSVTVYEAAFGFRAHARRSASGVALLHLLEAHGAPEGEDGVQAFRTEVESVLRHSD
ncbi:hypothetical protein [Saccharothrix coeruleofusca]|uniref:SMODS and SLOG-associating 2TM effector domain-containing protein n=1 Tax=Saccharothrix coeruleofusca TaxID=33919 RepID=A0A918ANW2_9PSEU|nr:hypothetical protein [Saccharothrix coeruleofusca]GGP63004.1 hypothetical protein GCM10010185_39410 [Saccharothrix coeruleofusca]